MSLVPATVSERMRTQYAQHRQQLDSAEQRIHGYITDNTQKERAALQKAYEDLHRRQTELLANDEMQRQQKTHRESLRRLDDLAAQLHDLQRKALRKIQEMQVSDDEKRRMWHEVEEAIERIVHSDDELRALRAVKKQLQGMFRLQSS